MAAPPAAAASAPSAPALYSTRLVDSGRVTLIGPFFGTPAAAREWCDSGRFDAKRPGTWTAFAMTVVHTMAAAAASASSTPSLYSTCLIDSGRVVSTGPSFDAPAAARDWCESPQSASTRTGTWTAFAMTVVYIAITTNTHPSPQPIRAFLLPAKGEVRELLIPAGRVKETIDATVIGDGPSNCHVVRCHHDFHTADRDHFTFWYNEDGDLLNPRPPCNRAITKVADVPVRGDVVIMRIRGGDDDDRFDPLSIPDDIKPADWKTLFD